MSPMLAFPDVCILTIGGLGLVHAIASWHPPPPKVVKESPGLAPQHCKISFFDPYYSASTFKFAVADVANLL